MVYKYINHRGLDLLRDHRIHISRPSSFNDPFEFLPQAAVLTRQQIELRLSEPAFVDSFFQHKLALREVNDRPSFDKWLVDNRTAIVDAMENHARNYRPEEFAALAGKYFGVTCFAKISNDLLMWAHYADSHKGMVIGFDEAAFGKHLRPVTYSPTRPEYHELWPSDRSERYMEIMSVKSDHWAYEQEVRLIIAWAACEKDGEHFYRIEPNDVQDVILGCRTTPALESDARTVLARDYPHVRLRQMRQHGDRYELVVTAV